jgi:hypothetical protein
LGLALLIVHYNVRHLLSKQAKNKVQDDSENNANYNAGYNREKELKAPLMHKYITREPSQEGNPLPEEQ